MQSFTSRRTPRRRENPTHLATCTRELVHHFAGFNSDTLSAPTSNNLDAVASPLCRYAPARARSRETSSGRIIQLETSSLCMTIMWRYLRLLNTCQRHASIFHTAWIGRSKSYMRLMALCLLSKSWPCSAPGIVCVRQHLNDVRKQCRYGVVLLLGIKACADGLF